MAVLITADDYEGRGPRPMYTMYQDYPMFEHRATWIAWRFPVASFPNVVIAGAGWGYLAKRLMVLGYNVAGVEGSAYCIGKWQNLVSLGLSAADKQRLVEGDATQDGPWGTARSVANLRGQRRFDLIVTEDVLTCLSDTEAVTLSQKAHLAMNTSSSAILHITTAVQPNEDVSQRDPRLNWKTLQGWRDLLGQDGSILLDSESLEATWAVPPAGNPVLL